MEKVQLLKTAKTLCVFFVNYEIHRGSALMKVSGTKVFLK